MFGVHALDGGNRRAGKPQVAVGVVLQNDHVVPARQFVQPLPLFQRHHTAGRVLEIGDDVDQLGVAAGAERLLQRIQIHAVLFHGNANQIDAVGAERIERADEAGRFAQHGVPTVQQHLAGKLVCLLCAGGGDQIICRRVEALLCLHPLFQQFPQLGISLCDIILQRQKRILLQQIRRDLADMIHRKRL